jgi:hypothetical protein
VADITAERFAIWVVWRTHLTAIDWSDRRVEAVIELSKGDGWYLSQ